MEPQEFYIGQKFYDKYPTEAATWCDNNNASLEEKHEEQDTGYGIVDVRYYEIVANTKPAPRTDEDMRKSRELEYQQYVDPITAHIQRLRDDDPESEEIAELMAERTAKREEIQAKYPYGGIK